MKLDTPYKKPDLTADQELMNFDFSQITQEQWDKNQGLKKMFPVEFGEVKPFRVLFLKFDQWSDPFNARPVTENDDHPVHALVMQEIRKLEKFYNASAKVAVLDGLPPGAKIHRHFDQSFMYDVCHRVHLPIVTAPDVKFYIDDVPYNFKTGEFFEFDNKRPHYVHNDSDIFRIHLVVDLLPNNIFPN